MLNEQQRQASGKFSKTMTSGVLDAKTGYMLRMAAAIAFSCGP
ncbi:hypothetical protein OAN24_05720 [Pseudodesulfovibrio sp.]|nr:hypothetical protein [Pseudodesulfovibrio sp.]